MKRWWMIGKAPNKRKKETKGAEHPSANKTEFNPDDLDREKVIRGYSHTQRPIGCGKNNKVTLSSWKSCVTICSKTFQRARRIF